MSKIGVLYRIYKHSHANSSKPVTQVMYPDQLREQIMEVVHGSLMGGHMGIKKIADKIQSVFYWPGIQERVTRHYKSCNVCQKIVDKGPVPKVHRYNNLVQSAYHKVPQESTGFSPCMGKP